MTPQPIGDYPPPSDFPPFAPAAQACYSVGEQL